MEIEVNVPETEITGKDISVETRNTNIAVSEDTKDLDITYNRKEYSIIGDGIFISSVLDDVPVWLGNLIDSTFEAAILSRDQNLINRMEAILTALDYVPKNRYTEQINQIVDEDGIINTRIATLNSNLTDALNMANATIAEIDLTYASKDEAAAIATNVLTASLSADGEIGSTLINLQSAYADLESTTAESITLLESIMEGEINGNAAAMQTIRSYIGINEAGASTGTGLSAYLEDSNGVIGGADSQLNNTIKVTAEGIESKFAYNSVVNINGIYKKSGFGLTTNYTSGNGTEVDPYVSEFWIDASRLKFTNSAMTGRTAPFTIDATGTTPQITFNGKVTFSNITDVPSLGTSSNNLLTNSAPILGNETYGWQVGWYNTNIVPNAVAAGFDSWRPTGAGSVYVVVSGAPTIGTIFDLKQSNNIPVVAGKRYEISALLSSHRCTSVCTLAFFNSAGTYISEIGAGTANSTAYSGNLSNWVRKGGFVTVPAGTSYAQFYIRSAVTGTDPYCFVAQAYTGEVPNDKTEFSSWGEGVSANSTTINGSKITTGSIAAAQIAAGTITADKISTYNLTAANSTFQNSIITNAAIANGAITNAKIGDAQITNAKIGTASIDTLNIQGEAVVVTRYAEGVGDLYQHQPNFGKIYMYYTPIVSHGAVFNFSGDVITNSMGLYINGVALSGRASNINSGTRYTYLYAGTAYTIALYGVKYNYNAGDGESYEPRYKHLTMIGAKR